MGNDKPAFYAALVMICGILAGRYAGIHAAVWAAAACIALILSLIILVRSRAADPRAALFSVPCILLLFFGSTLWYWASVEYAPNHISQYLTLQHPVRVYCRVADEPRVRDGKTTVLVALGALAANGDSIAIEGDALLTIVPNRRDTGRTRPVLYGELLAFDAVPEEPPDTRNPGEVSYRDYLATNNIFAILRVSGYDAVSRSGEREPHWFYEHIIFPSRRFTREAIRATVRGDEANYLTSLLLGDRSDLSREIQTAFSNTGTTHVLAVSGSHVVVIVVAIYALFGFLRLPRRVKGAATIVAIMYYMFLTGATPSVVRASLMASVLLAGTLVQRRSSVYNGLGISAILMFLYDPKQLFDVGFQLSFAAVFSMVYFYPPLTSWLRLVPARWKRHGLLKTVVDLFAVSAAAQIGTIPFTAFYFEKVSLVSFFANVVVVPLAGLNISLGFVSTLASVVSQWCGSCINEVNGVVAHLVLSSVTASDSVPYAIVHTASFGVKETLVYISVVALFMNLAHPVVVRRMALALCFLFDCLWLESACATMEHRLRVTFFDVGQGDAALVEFPNGATLLIDAGPRTEAVDAAGRRNAYDAGERVIVPALRRRGIGPISAMMVTHMHDDHSGGVPALMRELGAERLIGGPHQSGSVPPPALSAAFTSRTVTACVPGDTLRLDPSARIYMLHPSRAVVPADSADAYRALNNASIVCRICYGGVSFLLMGDADREVECELTAIYGDFLGSTVVKIGHHGSASGSSEDFLRTVSPRDAVVSVGRFNVFHHPSSHVMNRLRDLGIAAHRTDREGAIVYETDGRRLSTVQWR